MTDIRALILCTYSYASDSVRVAFACFDLSNNQLLIALDSQVYFSGVPPTSLTQWADTIESEVIATALLNNFVLDAKNILWTTPNFSNRPELELLAGDQSIEINGKTVGNTDVFLNTTEKSFLLTNAYVYVTEATGVGTPCVITMGKSGSGYSDIVGTFSLSILTTTGTYSKASPLSGAAIVGPGEGIKVRVATAALLYSSYKFKVVLQGVYM